MSDKELAKELGNQKDYDKSEESRKNRRFIAELLNEGSACQKIEELEVEIHTLKATIKAIEIELARQPSMNLKRAIQALLDKGSNV